MTSGQWTVTGLLLLLLFMETIISPTVKILFHLSGSTSTSSSSSGVQATTTAIKQTGTNKKGNAS